MESYNFSDMAIGLLDNLSIDSKEEYENTANVIFEIFIEIISHKNKSLTANYSSISKMAIRNMSTQSIDCIHQMLLGKKNHCLLFQMPIDFHSNENDIMRVGFS